MTNPHQALIQAISNLDIDAVEKYMDDDVTHFQAKKDISVKYLKEYFEWVATEKEDNQFMIRNASCTECCHEDGHKIEHKNVVHYMLPTGYMPIDLKPTQSGKFQIDYCYSSEIKSIEPVEGKSRFGFWIPLDLLENFKPDELYLKLVNEKENILSEIDNGEIVFWFLEDIKAWTKKNQWAINEFDKILSMEYDALSQLKHILFRMGFLYNGLISEQKFLIANQEFDQCNIDDEWEIYEWVENYRLQDFTCTSSCELNLDHVNEGYFTFKDFLPNLRFAVYGHTEFLKYLQNKDFAFDVTEEIRKDTLLEDIEDEWFFENWGKGIHLEFDGDSSED